MPFWTLGQKLALLVFLPEGDASMLASINTGKPGERGEKHNGGGGE